ncbi:MAG: hypothetical protein ACK4E0_00650 [Chitinophagaceae bacterium]
MKKRKSPYRVFQKVSSLLMIMALVWLTVSAPVVNAANQSLKKGDTAMQITDLADADDSSCNPFGNNTEEKAPNGSSSFNEEYLHHSDELLHAANLALQHYRALAAREYVAFHGELLCPPPNHAC